MDYLKINKKIIINSKYFAVWVLKSRKKTFAQNGSVVLSRQYSHGCHRDEKNQKLKFKLLHTPNSGDSILLNWKKCKISDDKVYDKSDGKKCIDLIRNYVDK